MQQYIVVTGATGAIGYEITKALLQKGECVVIACRNAAKSDAVAERLRGEVPDAVILAATLDLASEDSVRSCVEAISALGVEVKGLINNAGIMNRRYLTDSQGRELTMAVNYHNTKLLTELMLRRFATIRRVVFTTSLTRYMHGKVKNVEVDAAHFSQLGTYGLSKSAITEYASSLAQSGRVEVNCADPGVVDTGMITMQRWYDRLADVAFRPFIRKPRQGAIPALRAYYEPVASLIYCRRRVHKLIKK
jgi:NAD(P)-dependent dehydrogenase (short-subunit alcohol dehydrogenase family)